MKTYGGVKIKFHTFLISTLDGSGQLYTSAVLPPGKIPHTLNTRLGGPQTQSGCGG